MVSGDVYLLRVPSPEKRYPSEGTGNKYMSPDNGAGCALLSPGPAGERRYLQRMTRTQKRRRDERLDADLKALYESWARETPPHLLELLESLDPRCEPASQSLAATAG